MAFRWKCISSQIISKWFEVLGIAVGHVIWWHRVWAMRFLVVVFVVREIFSLRTHCFSIQTWRRCCRWLQNIFGMYGQILSMAQMYINIWGNFFRLSRTYYLLLKLYIAWLVFCYICNRKTGLFFWWWFFNNWMNWRSEFLIIIVEIINWLWFLVHFFIIYTRKSC